MKKVAKEKRIKILLIILLVFSLAGFFTLLLPAFVYNEFEHQFRKDFGFAIYTLNEVEEIIPYRSEGIIDPIENEEEFIKVGEEIETGIKLALSELYKAESTNDKQNLIPLLPKKYRNYHQEKVRGIEKHIALTEDFLYRKQNEQMITNLSFKIMTTTNKLQTINDNDIFWETMDNLPTEIATITEYAQTLYYRRFITPELYNYFMWNVDFYNSYYDYSQRVAETGSWEVGIDTDFANQPPENSVENIFEDSNKLKEPIMEKYEKDHEEAYNALQEASDYYNNNNLAHDKLSTVISKFHSGFPRNYVEKSGTPSIIPLDKNPEKVSLLNLK